MPRCNQIGYIHKSGTGQHSKKRRCIVISAILGRLPSDKNSLVDTPAPPPIPPDTAAAMAVADQDHEAVVHISSESSRSTVMNANSVHSTLSSISMTDTKSNGDGVLSTSSARLPATSKYPLNTELNADSCSTRLSLNKKKSIGVASYASITVLYARNRSELTNFRTFLLNSVTATMYNASPTSLCNYKSILKEHMNLVDSKLNGSSIMSPPEFKIITDNQSTVSSLKIQVPQ